MNAKQNLIFFIGVILIIMVFWANGYWSILRNGISKQSNSSKKPFVKKSGKCPPGYTSIGNICLPPGYVTGPAVMG